MVIALFLQIVTLGTALLSFGAALLAWRKGRDNTSRIQEVHVLVNQRMTDVQDRVKQLIEAMDAENVQVPEDPREI
jgi:hypothetical protein